MRSYFGVYADADYLAAAASTRLTGTSYRAATEIDVAGLLPAITVQARAHAESPLLRVHWYDAASRGVASGEQRRIATLPLCEASPGTYVGPRRAEGRSTSSWRWA